MPQALSPVANGGTGLASGTSGGIPYYSGSTTIASTPALTQYGPLYGGGAGNPPVAGLVGSLYQVYMSNGGSTYPAFTNLTYILDNVFGSTQGSLLYRGASTWTTLGPGTAGQCLNSGGAGANPSWASCAAGGGSYTPGVDAVATCSVDNTGATDTGSALNTCLTNNASVALRAGTYKTSVCINVPSGGSPVWRRRRADDHHIDVDDGRRRVPGIWRRQHPDRRSEPDAIGDAYQLRPWHPDGDRRDVFGHAKHHPQCALAK